MTSDIKIKELVIKELNEENKVHPPFHNQHEAYAVLREEVERLDEESKRLLVILDQMWQRIRTDRDMRTMLNDAERCAVAAAQRAIQLAAVCQKARSGDRKEYLWPSKTTQQR